MPPNADNNCVRGVSFRNITMYRPLKALYIKSNPGTSGVGTIEDISFQDIFIEQALWWTVWIGMKCQYVLTILCFVMFLFYWCCVRCGLGPQQQNQPGGGADGTGCNFLFPYIPVCPTNPLVTMRNIVLKNIVAVDTIPLFQGPGTNCSHLQG